MNEMSKHGYRWDHTENALAFWSMFVTKNMGNRKDRIVQFFLHTPCFATEKYDGTNIAKDDTGQIYSRKLLIDKGQDEFIDTKLTKVQEANVDGFKERVLEAAKLDKSVLNKFVVYGEFICNKYYDYLKRSIIGDWKVFGATLEVKRNPEETLEKLSISGFAAEIKSSNKHHIQIFANEKFVEIAKSLNIDVPEIKGHNETIAQVILTNKGDIKKGLIEGVVFTIYEEEFGHKVMKWKGAQEFQPVVLEKFLEANSLIQNEDIDDDIKQLFKTISEVMTDISENKLALRKVKKVNKQVNEKAKVKPHQGMKYLTNQDKDIILDGISHSQKKFDSIEKYDREEYKENLVSEVKLHLSEENSKFTEIDENILSFIRHRVNAVIKSQLEQTENKQSSSRMKVG